VVLEHRVAHWATAPEAVVAPPARLDGGERGIEPDQDQRGAVPRRQLAVAVADPAPRRGVVDDHLAARGERLPGVL
jgi:hypothetical protein